MAELYNEKGSVTGFIKVTDKVPDGVVILYNGLWFEEGGGGNRLTDQSETDIGYGAAFHSTRVYLKKVNTK